MKSPAKSPAREANGLREFLTIVFKRKKLILGVFLAVIVTATATSFLLTSVFEAKSSLLVKLGREYLNRPLKNSLIFSQPSSLAFFRELPGRI